MKLPLWRRRQREDLDEEIRGHLRMAVADRVARGASPDDAARAARREFGNLDLVKETTRDMWGWMSFDRLWQDVRYALRTLRRSPGFTVVALITLALGIGANTAIFTVVNAIVLRPLPFPEPQRLVRIYGTEPDFPTCPVSYPNFVDLRGRNRAFAELAAYQRVSLTLTAVDRAERLRVTRVSDGFFRVIGVVPAYGRSFLTGEDRPGHQQVAILSDGFWRRRFGADISIVGRTIHLDGEGFTVVGVLPAGFTPLSDMGPDLFVPLAEEAAEQRRGNMHLKVLGRLKPGIAIDRAAGNMSDLARDLRREHPEVDKIIGVRLVSLADDVVGSVRQTLWVLFGAAGFVLLIACANVANLLLGRSARRRGEMAVRVALGGGRWRLTRQLLTESLLLAIAGGLLGLLVGHWAVDALKSVNTLPIPRLQEIGMDRTVFAFTLMVSCLTGVIFGLAPAAQVSPRNVSDMLRRATAGRGGAAANRRTRRALVVAEVALSLILLVGAGLLARTLVELGRVDLGFQPQHVLTMQYGLPAATYPRYAQVRNFAGSLLDRVRTLPGVVSAGLTSKLPLQGGKNSTVFIEGQQPSYTAYDGPTVETSFATTGYFAAMGIPLTRGRLFTQAEVDDVKPVVIVNQVLVRRFFPGENPVGKRLRRPGDRWLEIIGVVGDTHQWGIEQVAVPETYEPVVPRSAALVVRGHADPMSLSQAIRAHIAALDRDQAVYEIAPMDDVVSGATLRKRFYLALMAAFAGVALVLAVIGLYGVISCSVAQRTHEIGIRVALGADRSQVVRMVVREGLALVVTGLAVGVAGALALTRYLETVLYHVRPTDPGTIAVVALTLGATGLIACALPAMRATRVDPVTALRQE